MVTRIRPQHAWIVVPFVLAVWSISRVWTVLPSIMGDEYVYTSQAKHLPFAEQTYSNYIFSWLMGLTSNCGNDFYVCTKTINSGFFLITVLLSFLIAIRFLTFGWSVFAASVTALSPIAIPVSYFMPETMYFSMMTLTVWLTLIIYKKNSWLLWSISGISLGLTALVKPHAIFMLPAFVGFAFLVEYKRNESSWAKGLLAAAASGVGFFFSKLALGFIFAGTEGLKLFGGYGSPVDAVSSSVTAENVTTGGVETGRSGFELFLTVSSTHLFIHSAALLLFAGVPLILALRVTLSVLRQKQAIGEASALFVLVALITVSMVSVVALFEAYVTVGGDDHSDRIILRYYEFLIPYFLIMGLLLPRFTDSQRWLRIIQGTAIIGASMFFVIYYPVAIDQQYADSSTLPGIGDSQGVFVFVGLFVASSVAFWIVNPEKGNLFIGRVMIPAVLILALVMSQAKLIEINGTPAYFDQAGWDSREFLRDVEGDKIVVVGQTRTEVFTVKFWIDHANIKDLLVVQGSVLGPENVEGSDYVVTLGDIGLGFEHEVLTSGEGYQLVKVTR